MTNKLAFTVSVPVSVAQLKSFINQINTSLNDGEDPLTIKKVMKDRPLLVYICEQAVNDGIAMYDPESFWNNDGWADWRNYLTR